MTLRENPSAVADESAADPVPATAPLEHLQEEARSVVQDPRTAKAAWWTFAAIVLSLLASVGGALCGAGPRVVIARRSRFAKRVREA